jgi:hypothetical protein
MESTPDPICSDQRFLLLCVQCPSETSVTVESAICAFIASDDVFGILAVDDLISAPFSTSAMLRSRKGLLGQRNRACESTLGAASATGD